MNSIPSPPYDPLERMKLIVEDSEYDYEDSHKEADAILCEVLRFLGYNDLIDQYEKVGKWYA